MFEKCRNVLEKVLSSHMLWYNDEGVYIRASLGSAHDQVKSECGALTRSINPEAITTECKYFAASFLHNGLREILRLADMFDEFHSDLLYKLKCGFSVFKVSYRALYSCTVHPTFALSRPGPRSCSVSSAPQ